MSFFGELKRRNVIRMAGLYLVGAWLLTQVASTVLPMFGAPDWLPRSIVSLLAIGFIPALIFSWVFELTPEGLKRDEDVAPEQSIAPQTGRRMDRTIIVVLALALGYFAFDKFVLTPRREAALTASALPNESKSVINEKSIAVLPFENLSSDKENAYFADGIQDEILTRLSKIADLKVISRTSTQHYKSAPENLPEIARQLGVAHILEGSVQKSGDAVRVNVQLIKAATDSHLWADTFDRKLTDIFSVESEVAKAIAEQLRAHLSGREEQVIAAKPTDNPEAYNAYLRGLAYNLKTADTPANSLGAQKYLREAVRLDPKFALVGRYCHTLMPPATSHRLFNQRSLCVTRQGRQPKRRSLFSPILARPCWPRAITISLA
jgi:TolB-like protein